MTKVVSDYTTNLDNKLEISKTKLKEQMHDLQDLGIELTKLSEQKLAKFELPQGLLDAINLAKKIKSNGALRRQYQYIGKLMRSLDSEYIRDMLAYVNQDSVKSTKQLHLCEKWRDDLINDSNVLTKFISQYPNCDYSDLKRLIINSRSEVAAKRLKSTRELFKFIRDIVEREI